ncbi:uncharacterized protein ACHE_21164A [Aspergillus chevalieri]|uniref:Uncharacterized protein n=1 Tax=Aspergillus chevalieri TaxID=182096 RepID=A0A7R7VJ94_ASPCH|nr:uncharacterized protein ACHE_21164A [Aspergillus chevalieri]BCR85706.1 hypothetical protein ACHE_21164A [Aspergillus chevalieri]
MSTTIQSRIVDLDGLIPRIIDIEREDDVENLIPWVFQHIDNAQGIDPENWPDGERNSGPSLTIISSTVPIFNDGDLLKT